MAENRRKEEKRRKTRDENWISFRGLKHRPPPCWLPVSADRHGGRSGVWRFLSPRSRGWWRRPPYWKRKESVKPCSVPSRSLCPAAQTSAGLGFFFFLMLSAPLAGLHAQLLPVGRLVHFRLGAGVGAPVERGHGGAFGVGVLSAVGWLVAGLKLRGALHLLQGAH